MISLRSILSVEVVQNEWLSIKLRLSVRIYSGLDL